MFGIAVAQLSTISDAEKDRYHQLYCGLCHELKNRYGNVSRTCLTYDLTFYVMLCCSLHEPPENHGRARCAAHPTKEHDYVTSRFTEYAADLSVALAYHKCLDDWHDDHSVKAKAASMALAHAYTCARKRIPKQCALIQDAMERIGSIEARDDAPPDAAAHEFGLLLGELFTYEQDFWATDMRAFGQQLGTFIYLMDAAVDFHDDAKSGSYNPFVRLDASPETMRTILSMLAGNAAAVFERLPLEQDAHLLRSVLYSGIWQKFNAHYANEDDDD